MALNFIGEFRAKLDHPQRRRDSIAAASCLCSDAVNPRLEAG